MKKQYIFIKDYQATPASFTGFVNAPIAMFKKGDIQSLTLGNIQPSWLPYNFYVFTFVHPTNPNLRATYTIPGNVIREYIKNTSTMANTVKESSYSGDLLTNFKL